MRDPRKKRHRDKEGGDEGGERKRKRIKEEPEEVRTYVRNVICMKDGLPTLTSTSSFSHTLLPNCSSCMPRLTLWQVHNNS